MTDTLKRKTLSSLVWKLLERGGNQVVALLVQIVMARILTPEDFGALAIMLVFTNLANVVVQSGLNTALVQAPKIEPGDYSTVFWLSTGISIVLAAVISVCAPAIAVFYDNLSLVWPLRALSLVLIVNAYNSVQVAIVQRELQFRKVFNATIASVLISGAAGVCSALVGCGLWALVVQQLVYPLVNCMVLALQVPWKPRFEFRVDRARDLFSFGWKLLVSGLLNSGYNSLSDLIVGKQFSSVSLGYVSQGKKYPTALGSMLDGAIQPVMLSAVSHVQDDLARVRSLVRRAIKTSTFLVMPAMTLFAVLAVPIVKVLLGEKWLPCVFFLQVYCFTQAIQPIHTSNLQALNAMGRSDLFLKLEVIKKAYGVLFLLLGAFVFNDIYIMIGSYLITGVISTLVNAWPNKSIIGYSYVEQIRDICPSLLLSLGSGAATYCLAFVISSDLLLILCSVALMGILYIGGARLFHVEAFEYLIQTAKELFGSRKGTTAND